METLEQRTNATEDDLGILTSGRLRELLGYAGIGVGIERLGGETISANATLAAILGYSLEDLRDKRFWDYTHPSCRDEDRTLFQELVDGRRASYTVEKRYICRDGRTTWGRLTRTLLHGADGKPAYAVGITADINERKKAEDALQKSEARYRNFAECASDWFFEIDQAGRLQYVSEGFDRSTGLASSEFVGRSLYEIVEPRSLTFSAKRAIRALRDRLPFRHVELELRQVDGDARWIQASANPVFDPDGGFLGYQGAATDITKRVLSEQALRESQRLYANVVESAPVGICIHQDGRFVFMNPKAVQIFGAREASELIGLSNLEVVADDAREGMRETIRRRYEEGSEERVEMPHRRLDGRTVLLRSTGSAVSFNGRSAIQAVFEDVTEERRIQSALEESEARLRAIVEASPAGIILKDSERRFVLANPAFCRFLECSAEDVLGRRSEDFLPPELAARSLRGDADIEAGCPTVTGEFCRRTRAGTPLHLSEVKFPIRGAKNELLGIGSIVTDVSESKRAGDALRSSGAMLRTLIDHIPAEVSVKDLSGRYVLMNRHTERSHGATDWESVPRTARDYFLPDHAAMVEEVERKVVEERVPLQYERTNMLKDGSRMTVLATKFPIMNAAGEVIRIGTIASDITARKKIEEDLRLAKEAAEVGSRAKTQFLANMSHELRTPLNSIIGFSELIRDETFGPLGHPKYREYVGDVLASGRSLLDLISDILDISRVEAGGMVISESWLDVAEVVRAAIRDLASRAGSEGVALETEMIEPLPKLFADELRIRQILINLLSNSVKFTPTGGRVTVRGYTSASAQLVLEVADTGIGIPDDKLQIALSVFGRIADPLTRSREGAGLGLPLSKKLAELHGGTLEVESEVGIGTTVRVAFPRERTGTI